MLQNALSAADWLAQVEQEPYTLIGDCNLVLHDATPAAEAIEAFLTKVITCGASRGEDECIVVNGSPQDTEIVLALLIQRLDWEPLKTTLSILDAMTCITLPDGSKRRQLESGLHLHCHLDNTGRCVGAQWTVSNVASATLSRDTSGRNLDVFYLLLNSLGAAESVYLGLSADDLSCAMLQSDFVSAIPEEVLGADFRTLLKDCGIGGTTFRQLQERLAACVHIGKLTFTENAAGARVQESTALDEVCALLRLDAETLSDYCRSDALGTRNWLMTTLFNSALQIVVDKLNAFLILRQGALETAAVTTIVYTPVLDADPLSQVRSLAANRSALALLFDNIFAQAGINAERAEDGLVLPQVGWSKDIATVASLFSELAQTQDPHVEETLHLGSMNDDMLTLSGASINVRQLKARIQIDAQCHRQWPNLRCSIPIRQSKLDLRELFEQSRPWSILMIDKHAPIPAQILTLQLSRMSQRLQGPAAGCIDFAQDAFLESYGQIEAPGVHWGRNKVWLTYDAWLTLPQQRSSEASKSMYGPIEPFISSRDDLLTKDAELQEIHEQVNPATKRVEVKPQTSSRRLWLVIVTLFTFWIPDFVLKGVGRMKRPDVRQAWREKVTLFTLIMLLCGCVIFYIIILGKLACPDFDKAWNAKEVSGHTADDDFFVALHGKVYDLSTFWRIQHSDGVIRTTPDAMKGFAGQDLSDYFPPPLAQACPQLVREDTWLMQNTSVADPTALHYSTQPKCLSVGSFESALCATNWYTDRLLPRMKKFKKGDLVVTRDAVLAAALSGERQWAIIDGNVYDLTNYYYTSAMINPTRAKISPDYYFLDDFLEGLFQGSVGRDVTKAFNNLENWDASTRDANLQCLQNAFYYGKVDFRQSAKCQANNYILLSFTILLCTVIVVKFLASLQFGASNPARQNRLVICQIPTYTEGEDQLRNAIDSVSDLDYPDELKLLFIVCDGILVGKGNKKPTCEIVLDILGVDQAKIDPPPLAYESVSEGSKVYNRAKTYAGLYEHDGHVVPYLVLVKVGNEKEMHRPGNRGKRDSQIMLMRFLNRFHDDKPMAPFEIEMAYQMSQVIGVSPGLYEYVLMLDADTKLAPDSLNVLVSAFQANAKLMGTCGETALAKKKLSWWTMIQVYEYYNSHALSKAFESLFGNVTCLPGCFCIYRIKSARGEPLLISDEVVDGYSDSDISTLHKKNLLTLGEDRYLTTLMTKHNTSMRLTFCPSAKAFTAAPETWSILLSQRRRWINSTIHNLFELLFVEDMCGFCCFSMRFVVIIDLFGTLILPATTAYLVYLIYSASSGQSALPLIAIIMLGAVYGLQALVFLLHRQWEHIGWMVIWIISYPVYSLILPLYSFWHQDDFSWGHTRVVIGEKGKQITYGTEDEEDLQPGAIPMQRWSEYAATAGLQLEPGVSLTMVTNLESPSELELHDYAKQSLAISSYSIGSLTEQQRKQQLREAVVTALRGCDLETTTKQDIERRVGQQVGSNLTALDMEFVDEAVDEHLMSYAKLDSA